MEHEEEGYMSEIKLGNEFTEADFNGNVTKH
jgi:hypothetical protein